MKRLLIASAMFLTFQSHAEIFKCKDASGNISYQGTVCQTETVSKIDKPPEIPVEEQVRANKNLSDTKEMNRQNEITRKLERQQQEDNARHEEASELESNQDEIVDQQTVILDDTRRRQRTLPVRRPATLPARLMSQP